MAEAVMDDIDDIWSDSEITRILENKDSKGRFPPRKKAWNRDGLEQK